VEGLYEDQALGRGRRRRRTWVQVCNLHKHHASQAFPQIENLRPRKNAAAGGTLVDAARGWALASRSSYHRVFRSRGRVSPGQASFAIRITQIWWLTPFSSDAPTGNIPVW